MAEYKNRSAEIHRPVDAKERSKVRVSLRRLVHCLYHSESKPMRYPAKIAHSGMIFFF
jgi:hypothetical protein